MVTTRTYDNRTMGDNSLLRWYSNLCSYICESCPSACCLMALNGIVFLNPQESAKEKEENDKLVSDSRKFFSRDFVIMFDFIEEKDVRVCPLAVNGRCLIYDDRPFICNIFTICSWRQVKSLIKEDGEEVLIGRIHKIIK